MSRDAVLKILMRIGIHQKDAEVYLFLAIKGPNKAEDIINSLQMPSFQLQNSLKKLQEKELVAAAPIKFVALPLETVLDRLAKARLQEAQEIEEKKRIILDHWHSLAYRTNRS